MKITYFYGEDDFDFEPEYNELHDFIVPVLVKDLKKSKNEVEELIEDDDFLEEKLEEYYDALKDYFQEEAEYEYEATQEPYDEWDDQNEWNCWRSSSLIRM